MDQNSPAQALSSAPNAAAGRRSGSVRDIYFPRGGPEHRDAIYIASFPEIIYFWPTVCAFFLCAFLQGVAGLDGNFLGWFTVIVLCLNLLVLVQDFDQKKFLILMLTLLALVLGVWIVNLYGFTLIRRVAGWILSFQPSFSTDAYLLLGFFTLALYVWGLTSPLFSYWKLEQNEFIHYTQPVGKDMSIARLGCTIYKEIPDIFECLLGFGAGSLVIRRDDQILVTIPHIPFLGRRMAAIEHMLSETRVVVEKGI